MIDPLKVFPQFGPHPTRPCKISDCGQAAMMIPSLTVSQKLEKTTLCYYHTKEKQGLFGHSTKPRKEHWKHTLLDFEATIKQVQSNPKRNQEGL